VAFNRLGPRIDRKDLSSCVQKGAKNDVAILGPIARRTAYSKALGLQKLLDRGHIEPLFVCNGMIIGTGSPNQTIFELSRYLVEDGGSIRPSEQVC
jgi:hypothetical protein